MATSEPRPNSTRHLIQKAIPVVFPRMADFLAINLQDGSLAVQEIEHVFHRGRNRSSSFVQTEYRIEQLVHE